MSKLSVFWTNEFDTKEDRDAAMILFQSTLDMQPSQIANTRDYPKMKVKKHYDFIPISVVKMQLNEVFGAGNWGTRNFHHSTFFQNEARAGATHTGFFAMSIELYYVHPITGVEISHVGCIDDKYFASKAQLNFAASKELAIKNAAKQIGTYFGAELNREIVAETDEDVIIVAWEKKLSDQSLTYDELKDYAQKNVSAKVRQTQAFSDLFNSHPATVAEIERRAEAKRLKQEEQREKLAEEQRVRDEALRQELADAAVDPAVVQEKQEIDSFVSVKKKTVTKAATKKTVKAKKS